MLLREIITKPFYAIAAVLILWLIFHTLFIYVIKLKPKSWIRLEYIWIIIGFMGVISFVMENNRNSKKSDLDFKERWIKRELRSLKTFTQNPSICFKYNKSDWMSQEEFDARQAESDKICQWSKDIYTSIQNRKDTIFSPIENYPKIELQIFKTDYTFERITKDINSLNQNIIERRNLKEIIESNNWRNFTYSFGVLFLIVAFAIRLTLVSKKLKDTNEETRT